MTRKTYRGADKASQRAEWMRQFQAAVYLLTPTFTGRIDWDTATYLFNEGYSPANAADRWLSIR